MFSLIRTLGGAIVNGVSNYFTTKQEIKKVEVEANKEVIVARAKATINRLQRESEQDFDLNRMAVENMKNSWKDDFILIIITMPFIMLFIPEYQAIAINGLEAMDINTPIWYQIMVISIFLSIYGLRDILKVVLQLIIGKVKKDTK